MTEEFKLKETKKLLKNYQDRQIQSINNKMGSPDNTKINFVQKMIDIKEKPQKEHISRACAQTRGFTSDKYSSYTKKFTSHS